MQCGEGRVATNGDGLEIVGRLLRLATESDQPEALLSEAWRRIRRPIGLVDAEGLRVAAVPDGNDGERALTAAAHAARGEGARDDHDWRFLPVSHGVTRLGVLAVPRLPMRDLGDYVLALLPCLCGDQLHRAAL